MSIPAPFISRVMNIEKDWIDYNGHLNMAYYNVLFDRCSDEAFEAMGLGPAYARDRRLTIYTAEVHVCYVQEIHLDHQVVVSFQLLDHDEKRLRFYQEIRHASEGGAFPARHSGQGGGGARGPHGASRARAGRSLDRDPPQEWISGGH
jgi:acyl-CoA thioesterase FadM